MSTWDASVSSLVGGGCSTNIVMIMILAVISSCCRYETSLNNPCLFNFNTQIDFECTRTEDQLNIPAVSSNVQISVSKAVDLTTRNTNQADIFIGFDPSSSQIHKWYEVCTLFLALSRNQHVLTQPHATTMGLPPTVGLSAGAIVQKNGEGISIALK